MQLIIHRLQMIIQNKSIELWRDIAGYEGVYMASNLGQIKSLSRVRATPTGGDRLYPERILKPSKNPDGYLIVTLNNFGKKCFSLHKLIALTWVNNIENKPVINHKDGNKLNNRADNLEWCTLSENTKHSYAMGLQKPGKSPNSQPVINTITGQRFETVKDAYTNLNPVYGIDNFKKKIKNKQLNYQYETKIK
jgi:hypothetical protein